MALLRLLRRSQDVPRAKATPLACGAAPAAGAAAALAPCLEGLGPAPRASVESTVSSTGSLDIAPQQLTGPRASVAGPAPRRSAIDVAVAAGAAATAAAAAAAGRTWLPPVPPTVREPRRCGGGTGAELEELFDDIVLLHRGRNALIYRARDRDSRRPVVVKAYDSRRAGAPEREARMLRDAAPHGSVVRLDAVVNAAGVVCLVLEACGGGTLIEAVANSGGCLPDRVAARRVAAPLLRALAHLHTRGIVHRDLRPEHILLATDGLRLADFSSAAYLPSREAKLRDVAAAAGGSDGACALCGGAAAACRCAPAPGAAAAAAAAAASGGLRHERLNHRLAGAAIEYAAPEVLSKPTATEVFHLVLTHGTSEEELPVYDEKADVWSAGALLFEALTGCQPFLADGAAEMAAAVGAKLAARDAASGLPQFLARAPGLSADARDFLSRCLEPRPEARPGAAELLTHPWVARRPSLGDEPRLGGAGDAAGQRSARASEAGDGVNSGAALRCLLAGAFGSELAAAAADANGAGDGAGGGGGPYPLHRSASAADTAAGPYPTRRSMTGRLDVLLLGRRAAAVHALVGGGAGGSSSGSGSD